MKNGKLLVAALGCLQQTALVAGALLGFGTAGWSNCWAWTPYRGYIANISNCKGTYCQAVYDGGCSTPQVWYNKRCYQWTFQQYYTPCTNPNDPNTCNVLPQQQVTITTAVWDNSNPC